MGLILWLCRASCGFERRHLRQPPQMSLGLAEFGREKRLDEVPSNRRSHRPAAHAEDIQVIVFDSLAGREVIVNERGANARHLVGTDGRADAAATDRQAPL